MNRIITLICSLLLATGCEKVPTCNDCARLAYEQTLCADVWGYGTNGSDAAVAAAVRDFFVSNGVPVHEVSVSNDGYPQACLACNCTTGRIIYVTTNAAYVGDFEYYGFY
jgi:hypothetical protein